MGTSDILIGLLVIAVLVIGVQIWRSNNIVGNYQTQNGRLVEIQKRRVFSNKADVFVLVTDGKVYVLGTLKLNNTRDVLLDGIIVGSLSANFLSGELILNLAGNKLSLTKNKA